MWESMGCDIASQVGPIDKNSNLEKLLTLSLSLIQLELELE
jgi:hypothetical protein